MKLLTYIVFLYAHYIVFTDFPLSRGGGGGGGVLDWSQFGNRRRLGWKTRCNSFVFT